MSEVLAAIRALFGASSGAARFCVAFSGGLDSTVLLHGLAAVGSGADFGLRAVHVNHGLHGAADDWQRHCAVFCHELGVLFVARAVRVAGGRGRGLEAEAREVRYAALAEELRPGECLLTAHHQDDQLETLLLHLARGSGVAGLAGIPAGGVFAAGILCRPLLDVPRAALEAYARAEGLRWIEDPSNADTALDRNYLRRRVVPAFRERWPAIGRAAGRAAALSGEAAGLLDALARMDSAVVMCDRTLLVPALCDLTEARQRNLLRYLTRARGWAVPPEARLREGLRQLLGAAPDRQPVVRWPGGEIRRYREHLYLLDARHCPPGDGRNSPDLPPATPGAGPGVWSQAWPGGPALELGAARGRLRLRAAVGKGLDAAMAAAGLRVSFRAGGEVLRAVGSPHRRTLKYLFQTQGIVPWMRDRVPLIWAGDTLAAVGDLWVEAGVAAAPGVPGCEIVWEDHAEIV